MTTPQSPAGLTECTEQRRLNEAREKGIPWKKWGPYLSERQWGTVREDYSEDGNAWDYFTHDQARSRAYRWGEDGLGGHLGRQAAPLLRARALEREGPDPQGAALRPDQQRGEPRRGRQGVLLLPRLDADALVHEVPVQVPAGRVPVPRPGGDEPRAGPRGARVRAARHGRLRRRPLLRRVRRVRQGGPRGHPRPRSPSTTAGPEAAGSTCCRRSGSATRGRGTGGEPRPSPRGRGSGSGSAPRTPSWATYALACEATPELLFTENETNTSGSGASRTPSPCVKDAFHRYVVGGRGGRRQPGGAGTKAAARYVLDVPAGGCAGRPAPPRGARSPAAPFGAEFDATFAARLADADEFYERITPPSLTEDERRVHRQALAGMLWSKQYYLYDVDRWLEGARRASAPRDAGRRPQRRLVPHVQRRHHLDARQVGVPVVRGVGPRLPHDRAVARRLRLRQGAAAADAAQPLQPPERPDPGLRVELQRRQSAGPRLGDAVPLPRRAGPRAARTSSSWSAPSRGWRSTSTGG